MLCSLYGCIHVRPRCVIQMLDMRMKSLLARSCGLLLITVDHDGCGVQRMVDVESEPKEKSQS